MATSDHGGLAGIEHTAEGFEEPEVVVDLAEVYGDAPADVDAEGPHEPLPPAELWEQFSTTLYCYVLETARQEANEALGDLSRAVRDERRPTADEIADARDALDRARELVEDHYAALAADTEPWADGVGGMVSYGVLAEQLRDAGYHVEYRGRDYRQ